MSVDFKAYSENQIKKALSEINDWEYNSEKKEISKTFTFKGYYKTIAFVNAIAWQAQKACHHPDLKVSFGKCEVSMTTHDVDGLSYKDFDLARTIDSLMF